MNSRASAFESDRQPNFELSTVETTETTDLDSASSSCSALSENGLENTSVKLLQERLKINRSRRKVGEVIVRKVVETRMVQVPVRREKLVVEQVTPEHQALAEIDLGEGYISQMGIGADEFNCLSQRSQAAVASGSLMTLQAAVWLLHTVAQQAPQACRQISTTLSLRVEDQIETVYCEFTSPQTAERSLAAMTPALFEQCSKVHLELVLVSPDSQPQFQSWFDRYQRSESSHRE